MSEKILVVDDEKSICDVLELVLSREGYEVFSANNGEEALKKLNVVLPDLIILDIIMPGIDGYEVCKRIRENPSFKKIPIIIHTGKSKEEDILKGFKAGANEYLTKPVNLMEFIAAVKRLLNQS